MFKLKFQELKCWFACLEFKWCRTAHYFIFLDRKLHIVLIVKALLVSSFSGLWIIQVSDIILQLIVRKAILCQLEYGAGWMMLLLLGPSLLCKWFRCLSSAWAVNSEPVAQWRHSVLLQDSLNMLWHREANEPVWTQTAFRIKEWPFKRGLKVTAT